MHPASTSWCMEELEPVMAALQCLPLMRTPQVQRVELLAYFRYQSNLSPKYCTITHTSAARPQNTLVGESSTALFRK